MTPNPNSSPELRALADIFEHFKHSKQGPGHCHDVPGIWDADNASDKAGKPCEWCAKWERARAVLISPQTLPAPGEVELAGHVRGIAQVIRAFPNDEAWGGPDMAQQAAAILDRAVASLATVAAANDEGVRLTASEQVAQWQQEYLSDPKPHWGDAIAWNSAFTIAAKLDETAAIRLLSQGGGK